MTPRALVFALVVVAAGAAHAHAGKPGRAAAKKVAISWVRHLEDGDAAGARALTGATLVVAAFDRDQAAACNGTHDTDALDAAFTCLADALYLEHDTFVPWTKAALDRLPASLSGYRTQIADLARTARVFVHRAADDDRSDVVIIAVAKGARGRPRVVAVFLAHTPVRS
jgi:hypothetical protein